LSSDATPHLFTYDAIAAEYYDPTAHPTCNSFSLLSHAFIRDALADVGPGIRIVELGAGGSVVAPILHGRGLSLANLEVTDASAAMLRHSMHWADLGATLKVVDALELPYPSDSIDVVIASMADPYNRPLLWAGIARVLKDTGRAIVTLPSFEWAARFRGKAALPTRGAEFVLRDGRTIEVPSHLYPLHRQVEIIEDAGLALDTFQSLGSDWLCGLPPAPKLRVFQGAFSSYVWGIVAVKTSPLA
jgi:SAM-dependent methyltransferase